MSEILVAPESGVVIAMQSLAELTRGPELNEVAILEAIEQLGQVMEKQPQAEAHLEHIFTSGLYGRHWSAPRGTYLVTELWKEPNISSLIKGKIAVMSTKGQQILEAPRFFVTPAGTQRVMFIIEDTEFTTVHPNPDEERDTDILLDRLVVVHDSHRERNKHEPKTIVVEV